MLCYQFSRCAAGGKLWLFSSVAGARREGSYGVFPVTAETGEKDSSVVSHGRTVSEVVRGGGDPGDRLGRERAEGRT